MVILGAGGHAKELLEILLIKYSPKEIALFDNVTPEPDIPKFFLGFKVLRKIADLERWYLQTDQQFVLGVGGIAARKKLYDIAILSGGLAVTISAENAEIGQMETKLAEGTTVMQMAFISNSVYIGKGTLINTRASVHHDVIVGEFCEIGPGAMLLGRSQIGNGVFIGAGAIILPDMSIGNDCVVGAGSVVTKNVLSNCTVKGNPAR